MVTSFLVARDGPRLQYRPEWLSTLASPGDGRAGASGAVRQGRIRGSEWGVTAAGQTRAGGNDRRHEAC